MGRTNEVVPTERTKIALTGKMRTGKDTVAEIIVNNHSSDGAVYAFGDELKQLAHEIFPYVPRVPKPRDLYQFMNVMRNYDEDVWVNHMDRRINSDMRAFLLDTIVITDVRQQNEYEWCRKNGFTIVRVESSDNVRKERMISAGESASDEALSHKTEQYSDSFDVDYVIENSGTVAELEAEVERIMKQIKEAE